MKDAHERRTLLLELGNVLRMLVSIDEYVREVQTIGELIERYPALGDEPLLEYVAQSMIVSDFQYRVLHAFCEWPELLLETPLDHAAIASSVRDHLFEDNPFGWESYAGTLAAEVPWFATAAPVASA